MSSITFPPGNQTQCFTGSIIDDEIHESTESFTITIVHVTDGVVSGPNTPATVNIIDNDGGLGKMLLLLFPKNTFFLLFITVLVIGGDNVTVIEDRGPARVCIRLTGVVQTSSGNVRVQLRPTEKDVVGGATG